jgi:hypothetical protein
MYLLVYYCEQSSYHIGFNKRKARLLQSIKRKKLPDTSSYFPSLKAMLKGICFGAASPSIDTPPFSLVSSAGAVKREVARSPSSSGPSAAQSVAVSGRKRARRASGQAMPSSSSAGREGGGAAGRGRGRVPASWACTGCTLLNSASYWKCTLCHTDRVQLPAALKQEGAAAAAAAVLHSPAVSIAPLHKCLIVSDDDDDDDDDIFEQPSSASASASRSRPKPPVRAKKRPKSEPQASRVAVSSPLDDREVPILRHAVIEDTCTGDIIEARNSSADIGSVAVVVPLKASSSSITSSTSVVSSFCEGNTSLSRDAKPGSSTTATASPLHRAYCSVPLSDTEMQQLLFNGLRNEYTTQCFHQMVQTVVVSGRRLGSVRPGKNRLIGEN